MDMQPKSQTYLSPLPTGSLPQATALPADGMNTAPRPVGRPRKPRFATCANCGTNSTPLWRRSVDKTLLLCNGGCRVCVCVCVLAWRCVGWCGFPSHWRPPSPLIRTFPRRPCILTACGIFNKQHSAHRPIVARPRFPTALYLAPDLATSSHHTPPPPVATPILSAVMPFHVPPRVLPHCARERMPQVPAPLACRPEERVDHGSVAPPPLWAAPLHWLGAGKRPPPCHPYPLLFSTGVPRLSRWY